MNVLSRSLIAAALLVSAPASAAPKLLTYLNAPAAGAPILVPPRLLLSLGGAPFPVVMDTGSTGIVVSASRIPGFAGLPGPAGMLEYSSSGRIERGRWVRVAVTVSGANGASITTTPIRVLAVTRVDCVARARDCLVRIMPRHVAVMGIGFGREADHQQRSTPDINPFLALGGGRRGYVVTRGGVTVGLDAAALRGFATVRLQRSARWPDWGQAPGCISVAGAAAACGVSLMDTGVVAMYLSLPSPAPAGAALRIALPGPRGAAAAYAVSGAMAPARIVSVPNRPTFVNMTVRFLNGFDYLYDASRGLVGYRRNPVAGQTPPSAG